MLSRSSMPKSLDALSRQKKWRRASSLSEVLIPIHLATWKVSTTTNCKFGTTTTWKIAVTGARKPRNSFEEALVRLQQFGVQLNHAQIIDSRLKLQFQAVSTAEFLTFSVHVDLVNGSGRFVPQSKDGS
jgi:hypothetical protein